MTQLQTELVSPRTLTTTFLHMPRALPSTTACTGYTLNIDCKLTHSCFTFASQPQVKYKRSSGSPPGTTPPTSAKRSRTTKATSTPGQVPSFNKVNK